MSTVQYQDLVRQQRHASEALVGITEIRGELQNAQDSLRSYVVSAEPATLEAFNRSAGVVARAASRVQGDLDTPDYTALRAATDAFASWHQSAQVEAVQGGLLDPSTAEFQDAVNGVRDDVRADLTDIGDRLEVAAPIAIGSMSIAGIAAIAVAIGLTRRVNNQVAAPMQALASDTRELGGGDLTVRTSASGVREVDDIAHSFNRMAARLEETVAGLRELDELKSEFVSMVSHELRTPLTSILGYVDALLDEEPGPLNDEQREYADAVDRNAKRLQALVEDLLTLSRLDAGRLQLELVPVELGPVVASVCRDLGQRAAAKDVTLTADTPAGLVVDGDADRLAQIVINLVSNAVKFTPSGRGVHVDVRRDDDDIVVEVRDEGIGIPTDELPHLFERFFRAHGAGTIEGTGLGLAITAELVDLHGGTITVASVDGEGSTFTVRFPASR